MSSIDPNPSNSLDVHDRYAISSSQTEKFYKQYGLLGNERVAYDHASILANQPVGPEALKELTGELMQRRAAYYQMPQGSIHLFLYDTHQNTLENLQSTLNLIEKLDCSSTNAEEQTLRQQERSVFVSFIKKQIAQKQAYDEAKLRILEFIQA